MTIEQTDTHPASNAESTAPVPMRRFRWKLALALAIPIVVGSCLGVRALQPLADRTLAEHSALQLDLSRPDALIESASLVSLPKDLLSAPLLRDTLTEDFVFYYEGNADRLGITGALRRIAYEHELGWRDDLIHDLLDQPAEVALWRGDDGKLKYALMVLGRGALAKVLQPLAEAAASDTQLTQVGELHVDGSAAAVYRLRYNFDHSVLLIPYEDQLLVLSSTTGLQSLDSADLPTAGLPHIVDLLVSQRFPGRVYLGTLDGVHRLQHDARGWRALPRLPEIVRQIGVTTEKSSPNLTMVVHLVSPDNSRDALYLRNYGQLNVRDDLLRIPGMGSLIGEAVLKRQYVALQSMVALIAIFFVLLNFLIDYLYTVLDPRIRERSS